MLPDELPASAVHCKEAVQERKRREVASAALEPEFVRAVRTDSCSGIVALVGVSVEAEAQIIDRTVFQSTAPAQEPGDFIPCVVYLAVSFLKPPGLFEIVYGSCLNQRRNHSYLSVFGPGDKGAILLLHDHNII